MMPCVVDRLINLCLNYQAMLNSRQTAAAYNYDFKKIPSTVTQVVQNTGLSLLLILTVS